jgi:hypothetical protein
MTTETICWIYGKRLNDVTLFFVSFIQLMRVFFIANICKI